MQKTIIIGGVVVAVIGLGVGIGLLSSGGITPHVSPPVVETAPITATNPSSIVQHSTTHVETFTNKPVVVTQLPVAPVIATNQDNGLTNWENDVDEILGSTGEDSAKVKQLLEMFPKLSEEGQVEVAQHLSNLVDDSDYAPLGEMLKNQKLPEAVLDVLMGDVLNRPNSVKLPLLLEVAKNPDHAKAEEARDLVELYLDKYPVTTEEVNQWLKQNPD